MERKENTVYVLSLSYGKDSLACLGAIEKLGWPLDAIVHAEVWATDTIPADLPPMVEFKQRADAVIKERYGIEVQHISASRQRERESYESTFYRQRARGGSIGKIYGFPTASGGWCRDLKCSGTADIRRYILSCLQKESAKDLRLSNEEECLVHRRTQASGAQKKYDFFESPTQGANKNTVVQYLGIALDEPIRLARLDGINLVSPLAAIGWTEADCRKWCEENALLSPIYTTSQRGGCWFCHYQSIDQLRLLRKNYPDLWQLLLKWDTDSPVSFHADGHTVHDFDKRFAMEEQGLLKDRPFRWKYVTDSDTTSFK